MEIAGGQDSGQKEKDAYPWIEGETYDPKEEDLAQCTCEGQSIPDEIELPDLSRLGEKAPEVPNNSMEAYVEPAADGILG